MQLTDPVAKKRNKGLRVYGVRHEERAAASAAALFFPKKRADSISHAGSAKIPCGKLCMLGVALLRFHRAPRSLAKGHRSYARAQKLAAYSRIQWFSCIRIFTVACCLARNQLLFFPPRPLPKKYPVLTDCFCFWQTSCGFSLSFFKRAFCSSDCCSRFFMHSSSISYTALPSMISLVDMFFPFIDYTALAL